MAAILLHTEARRPAQVGADPKLAKLIIQILEHLCAHVTFLASVGSTLLKWTIMT